MSRLGVTKMKLRDLSLASAIAIVLALVGIGLGVAAMILANPFLGLFAVTVVCSGGVVAMVGLQE